MLPREGTTWPPGSDRPVKSHRRPRWRSPHGTLGVVPCCTGGRSASIRLRHVGRNATSREAHPWPRACAPSPRSARQSRIPPDATGGGRPLTKTGVRSLALPDVRRVSVLGGKACTHADRLHLADVVCPQGKWDDRRSVRCATVWGPALPFRPRLALLSRARLSSLPELTHDHLPAPATASGSSPCPTTPIPFRPARTGTVTFVNEHGSGPRAWLQIGVDWDNGRKLMLSVPPDEFEAI